MTASEADPSFGLPNPMIEASKKIVVRLVYHPYAANVKSHTFSFIIIGASCRIYHIALCEVLEVQMQLKTARLPLSSVWIPLSNKKKNFRKRM